jgi:hypothetical protein
MEWTFWPKWRVAKAVFGETNIRWTLERFFVWLDEAALLRVMPVVGTTSISCVRRISQPYENWKRHLSWRRAVSAVQKAGGPSNKSPDLLATAVVLTTVGLSVANFLSTSPTQGGDHEAPDELPTGRA